MIKKGKNKKVEENSTSTNKCYISRISTGKCIYVSYLKTSVIDMASTGPHI